MATTLVGIYDDFTKAQAAARDLTKAGVKQGDVTIARNEPAGKGYMSYGGANSKDYNTGTSVGDSISNFFGNLFDGDDDPGVRNERDLYAESVRRGSTAVIVRVEDKMVERVADVLNDGGAVDVDRRAAQYRKAGYKNHDTKAAPYTAEQRESEM